MYDYNLEEKIVIESLMKTARMKYNDKENCPPEDDIFDEVMMVLSYYMTHIDYESFKNELYG